MKANSDMICMYWNIVRAILQRQKEAGWGAKAIDRISRDLKEAYPEMSGFSPRNIKYMRKFADSWRDYEIVQRIATQIALLPADSDMANQLFKGSYLFDLSWLRHSKM